MKAFYLERQSLLYPRRENDPEQLGIYIGLGHDEDGFIQRGALVMMNFYSSSFGFDIKLKDNEDQGLSDHIKSGEIISILGLSVEEWMKMPNFSFSIAELTTTGEADYKKHDKKVRKQHLTNEGNYNAQLDLKLIPFLEFPWPESPKAQNLKNYTRNLSKQNPGKRKKKGVNIYDPGRKAGFSDTLDLHAYALVDEPRDYNSTEILILQLKAFESFLDEAVSIGFDKVTVIHGVGKGKLREEIFSILRHHPFVDYYKNEFHPKYKFGATEIFLQ